MARRDVTQDGSSDLVWINQNGSVGLWDFDGGAPSFVALPPVSVPTYFPLGSGFYNRDAFPDVLWGFFQPFPGGVGYADGVGYWTGSASGVPSGFVPAIGSGSAFFPAQVFAPANFSVVPTDNADFNGDGLSDFALVLDNTPEIAIYATQQFGLPIRTALLGYDPGWSPVAFADFNADRTTDVLWRNDTTGEVGIWSMRNSGPYAWHSFGAVGLNWEIALAGDFNGDGRADLLWTAPSADGGTSVGTWTVLRGGDGRYEAAWTFLRTVYGAWSPEQVGDFTGDGSEDVFWRNAETGENLVWDFDGGGVSRAIVLARVGTDWFVG